MSAATLDSASRDEPRGRKIRRLILHGLPAAVLLALFVVGWQLVALHNGDVLPRVDAIWSELVDNPREYLDAAGITLQESGVGLGASFVVAFSLAVAMVHFKVVERAVMPLAVVLNVTPVVTLAPGLAIALGFSITPRYVVTGIIVFFPLLVNSLVGLRSIDADQLDYFKTLHASRSEILVHLRVPSSLPFLFAAARICFPLSIVGAVVSELTAGGAQQGLGSLIELSIGATRLAGIYAPILCLAVLGLIFTLVVTVLERRFLFWHASRSGVS